MAAVHILILLSRIIETIFKLRVSFIPIVTNDCDQLSPYPRKYSQLWTNEPSLKKIKKVRERIFRNKILICARIVQALDNSALFNMG